MYILYSVTSWTHSLHTLFSRLHTELRTQPDPTASTLRHKASNILYQLWRGFPVTTQKLSGDLQKAWGLGARFVQKVLWITIPSKSVYRWLVMQMLLAGIALLFSMMPHQFFQYDTIQWLLTTVIVISAGDFTLAVFLNSPNRASQSVAVQLKTCFGLVRSFFYDLFLYPTLILSILQLIQTQSYLIFHGQSNSFENEDSWQFATFSVIASLYVMTVYSMRFGVFSSAVGGLLHNHTNITTGSKKASALFLKGFLAQNVIQIAVQIMMLIMISVRYQAERGRVNNYYMRQEDGGGYGEDDGETVSKFLKVMIAGGLLIPILALPMYFVSMQKQVEEFPISLYLNSPSEQRAIRRTSQTDTNTFRNDFNRFHNYNVSFVGALANVLQPLFSPVQVVLCALYTLLLLSFFVCFSVTHSVNEDAGRLETVNAFSAGLYSDVYNMPRKVTEATFVVALLLTIVANFLPILYGMLGAFLLPLNLVVGSVWMLAKKIRFGRYNSIQTV